jgi:hypothetical protein
MGARSCSCVYCRTMQASSLREKRTCSDGIDVVCREDSGYSPYTGSPSGATDSGMTSAAFNTSST